jgi:hypothetical protein
MSTAFPGTFYVSFRFTALASGRRHAVDTALCRFCTADMGYCACAPFDPYCSPGDVEPELLSTGSSTLARLSNASSNPDA